MPIATLTIDLNAKLANLQASFDKAAQLSEKSAKRMQESFTRAGEALAVIGAGVSVAGIVAFTRTTINAVDALNDFHDATGASVENAFALEDIARRTGTAFSDVEGALVKFNDVLKDAKPDSAAAKALQSIKLSAEELKRIDPAEALLKTAQALNNYADDGNRARLVQELFGKSVKEVAPFLNDLAEKGELNATATAKQAAEAEKFNKQLFELETNLNNSARAITMEMIPAVNGYTGRIKEAMEASGGYLGILKVLGSGSWGDAFKLSAGLICPSLGPSVADLRKELDGLQATRDRYAQRGNTELLPGLEQKITSLKARLEVAKAMQRQAALADSGGILDALDAKAQGGGKPSVPALPKPPALTAKPAKEYDAALEISRRAADAYASSIEKIAAAQQSAEESALTLTPAQKALRDMLQDPVWQGMPDAWKETALQQSYVAIEAEKIAAQQKRLNDLLDAAPSAALEKQREDMKLLAGAFESGAIGADRYFEAVQTALGNLDKATDATGQGFADLKNAVEGWGKDAAGAMVDFATTGKESFGDMTESILKDISKMLVYKNITGPLATEISSFNWGSIGSAISSFFFSADGNAFTSAGPVKAFATGGAFGNGGVLTSPTMFGLPGGGVGVAGEAGPEGALPLKRMSNGKLGVYAQGGGGGVQVNVYNNAGGVAKATATATTDASGATQINVMVDQIEGVMRRRIRQGAGLAPDLEGRYGLNPAAGAHR